MNSATKQAEPAPSGAQEEPVSESESEAASKLRRLRSEFEAEYAKDMESLGLADEGADSQVKGKRTRRKVE